MKQSVFFKAFIVAMSLLLYSSCSSDNDEIFPEPEPTYSVVDVKYTLEEGDGITIETRTFPLLSVSNKTASAGSVGGEKDLICIDLTSSFQFSPSLPDWIYADTITVLTPFQIYNNKVAIIDRGFGFAYGYQPVQYGIPYKIAVPPYSEVSIKTSARQEKLQATVEVVVENDLTGERVSYEGKWVGTIGYSQFLTEATTKELD